MVEKETRVSPADRASVSGLRTAIAGFFLAGLMSWLGQVFGIGGLLVGGLVWVAVWTASVGLAIAALRNAYDSRVQAELKQRSRVALGIDGVTLVLVCGFLSAIMRG